MNLRGFQFFCRRKRTCRQTRVPSVNPHVPMRPDRKYVTPDDPDVCYLAKKVPALFMQRYTPPVLIDEIQDVTELLPVDEKTVCAGLAD